MSDSSVREVVSDEATQGGLKHAMQEGEAFQSTLAYMLENVVDTGGSQRSRDYIISYAYEEAEGLYHYESGNLAWHEPENENLHVEVVVCDAGDGRFIPCLNIFATLINADGREIGTREQPFLWHPTMYHYGRNWTVPGDGIYHLRVRVEPPTFSRHDKVNGKRYTEPIEVEFRDTKVKTGKK